MGAGGRAPGPRPWVRVALAMFAVGWGANQFSPMLLVYHEQRRLSQVVLAAMFGCYALGLIPALLVAAALSDRMGRRRLMRPVLILSTVASLVLVAGAVATPALFAGRLLAGVASGTAFAPGSAWVKELSADAPGGSGARRATVALSAGFGGGPLVAGAVAQWLPYPQVLPYLVHIAVMLVVAPLAWRAPETVTPGRRAGGGPGRGGVRAAVAHPVFLRTVVPTAPWVFATATVGFAVLPGLVIRGGDGLVLSGATAGLVLGTGVLVQPLARRVERWRAGAVLVAGVLVAAAGLLLAAVTAATAEPTLLIPAAVVLGAAYGLLLVAGLGRVQALAPPEDLAGVTAVFYCLIYLGFAAPYVVAAAGALLSPAALFCVAAGAVTATLPLLLGTGGVRAPR
uniref:Putative MFS permease n=1 Tax=Streptantibioticus cattleyicolor TaxID=29303 RepID=Q1EMW0_STRCT|nr:putative MFS permease [Streptantibioticus cattleyicolor]